MREGPRDGVRPNGGRKRLECSADLAVCRGGVAGRKVPGETSAALLKVNRGNLRKGVIAGRLCRLDGILREHVSGTFVDRSVPRRESGRGNAVLRRTSSKAKRCCGSLGGSHRRWRASCICAGEGRPVKVAAYQIGRVGAMDDSPAGWRLQQSLRRRQPGQALRGV